MHIEYINRVLRSRFWLFLRLVPRCFYRNARGIEGVCEGIGRLEGEDHAIELICGALREVSPFTWFIKSKERVRNFELIFLVKQRDCKSSLHLVCFYCSLSFFIQIQANRFGALLIGGVAATFFFYFALNMSMVMGLAPVVGVPLPLVSYGGSAMLVLLGGFGLIQSAHIHRPK